MSEYSSNNEISEDTNALSTITGTNVPVLTIATRHGTKVPQAPSSSLLPSHTYRYALWHDLQDNDIHGTQLKHPRVRKGPEKKELYFYTDQDDYGRRLYHSRKGVDRRNYQKEIEDWENAVNVNLSYQELGHPYQLEQFYRIAKRLLRAEKITLIDNSLENMHSVNFPVCSVLNLSQNYIRSFRKLPKCRNIKTLILTDNCIETLDGIGSIGGKQLQSLELKRNPCTFIEDYRRRVFKNLPNLKELDGIPRLVSDLKDFESLDTPSGGCIIS